MRAARTWAARNPLLVHSLIVFGVGWPIIAALATSRQGHGAGGGIIAGRPVEEWLSLAYVLLFQLPAAFLATYLADGSSGVRDLARRAIQWRIGIGLTAALAFALPLIAMALAFGVGGRWRADAGASVLLAYVWSVIERVAMINLWEELTWAGFFQWRLQRAHGLVRAAIITAIPFAAMHVAIFRVDGPTTLSSVVTLLVFATLFRLAQGTVLAATGGSALAAALLHASFNSTNNREGILYASISGVDLAWEALAAALLLALVLAIRVWRARRKQR